MFRFKLREIELKVQREINEKRQELLAKEESLRWVAVAMGTLILADDVMVVTGISRAASPRRARGTPIERLDERSEPDAVGVYPFLDNGQLGVLVSLPFVCYRMGNRIRALYNRTPTFSLSPVCVRALVGLEA